MSKLIYVHNDNEEIFDIVVRALKEHGYSPEYTNSKTIPAVERLHADLVLICQHKTETDRITLGDLTLDLDAVCAYAENQHIHFTPIEFAMLSYLMQNHHRAVPRRELLKAVWEVEEANGSRVADDTAKRLRRKLKNTSVVLETVWNYGFRIRSV